MAATAERLMLRKPTKKVWLIGEDIFKAPYQAFRNMANPPEYGDPDYYAGETLEYSTYLARARLPSSPELLLA